MLPPCMCVCRAASLNLPPCRSNVGLQEDGGEGRLVVSLFDDWIERWQQRQAAKARAGGSGGKPVAPRLFTVGRLDVQSVGLIFVTNDGDWAHRWVAGQAGVLLAASAHACIADTCTCFVQHHAFGCGPLLSRAVTLQPTAVRAATLTSPHRLAAATTLQSDAPQQRHHQGVQRHAGPQAAAGGPGEDCRG